MLVGAQSKPVAVYKRLKGTQPSQKSAGPRRREKKGREVEENKAEGKRALSLS